MKKENMKMRGQYHIKDDDLPNDVKFKARREWLGNNRQSGNCKGRHGHMMISWLMEGRVHINANNGQMRMSTLITTIV